MDVQILSMHEFASRTSTLEACVAFAGDLGLIPNARDCIHCGRPMGRVRERRRLDGFQWRCSHRRCRRVLSARHGTWFFKSKLTLKQALTLMYCWSNKEMQLNARFHAGVSDNHTSVDWYNYCREICFLAVTNEDVERIGGVGKFVEIDESKFGKRKFHRGRRVEGQWVFGGVERGSKKVFLTCVADRTALTLEEIIVKYVEPGTTILSDCRRAYNTERLSRLGYFHQSVNHTLHFRDPVTGVHTNTIEGTWSAVKRSLPRYGTVKDHYDGYFAEFIWRRKYVRSPGMAFHVLVEHILQYHHEIDGAA